MIYEVEWLETARRDLEEILNRVGESERFAVARVVARINDRLAIAPYSQSESRPPHDIRILIELPLAVRFRIERFGERLSSFESVW